MKLLIPSIGAELKLQKAWAFKLFHESRNESLFEVLGLEFDSEAWRRETLKHTKATIPAGTILKVDRIYIRKGASEFDSLSFNWKGQKTTQKHKNRIARQCLKGGGYEDFPYVETIPARGVRFWAKLSDVNNMEVEIV